MYYAENYNLETRNNLTKVVTELNNLFYNSIVESEMVGANSICPLRTTPFRLESFENTATDSYIILYNNFVMYNTAIDGMFDTKKKLISYINDEYISLHGRLSKGLK